VDHRANEFLGQSTVRYQNKADHVSVSYS